MPAAGQWLRQPLAAPLTVAAALLALALALMLPGSGAAHAQTGAPAVTAVAVTSDAGVDGTYALGETIRITLTFSEAVDVTGTPQLAIDMDPAHWGEKWAGYESGSGTTSLTFAHEVGEPNLSTSGIAVLANTLKLDGGSIKSAASQADAALSHAGLAHDADHKVDWRLSQDAPTITSLAITSDAGDDDTYAFGEAIRITLAFSEAVDVTGTPQLAIDMDPAHWGEKWAGYESGSGTNRLTFAHEVVEPNLSTSGIAVLANTLKLSGGSIKSAASQAGAALSHSGLGHDAGHKVDWRLTAVAPNRAPLVNRGSQNYAWFVGRNNAPRGFLVSKSFAGLFSDPDGDNLSYTVAISAGRDELVEQLVIAAHGRSDRLAAKSPLPRESSMRVFFEADADDDWDAIVPALPERPLITITLTATDPGGLSASVQGDFLIDWEPKPDCALTAPSSVQGLGIQRGAVVRWTLPEGNADTCEVAGFTIAATNGAGLSLEARLVDPAARSHTIRGLDPGGYRFSVRIEYAEGASEALETAYSNNVPGDGACITFTVEPYAHGGISGRITEVNGTGCLPRETFDIQVKRTANDYWGTAGRFRYSLHDHADQPHFIFFQAKPYVGYDFRIAAYDASDSRYLTNTASTTIVANDPTEMADANSPANVRVLPRNDSDLYVTWEAPASFGTGRTLQSYEVEWRKVGETTASGEDVSGAEHVIGDLTDGERYTVRVGARTIDALSRKATAWSVWSPAFEVWSEPTQVWFSGSTPTFNHVLGRAYMFVSSNKSVASVCTVDDAADDDKTINCPPAHLVSLAASGSMTLRADGTSKASSRSASSSLSEGQEKSVAAPVVRASGGNGSLHVVWEGVTTAPSGGQGVGAIDAYIVQHRSGTSGAWTDVTKTATDRKHEVTGLSDGVYQVRVRARDNADDGDPMTTDTPILGFTSEILEVTLATSSMITRQRTERQGDGTYRLVDFQVSDGKGDVGIPSRVRVTLGDSQSLIVEWEPPQIGAAAFGYQVRHRESGATAWTESAVLYPRQTLRLCSSTTCLNPRRYEITGLTGGTFYEVQVRVNNKDANGAGGWSYPRLVRPND